MNRDKSPEERYKERQKQAKPLLEAFFEWLHTLEDSVDRSSLIGEAVLYTLNQEVYLKRYLEDGHLSIDNLAAERALQKLATGETELAFCKEHPWSAGQRDCIQHHGNSHAKRAETLQLSHLCDGADERSWSVPGKRKPCWNCFPGPPACQLIVTANLKSKRQIFPW